MGAVLAAMPFAGLLGVELESGSAEEVRGRRAGRPSAARWGASSTAGC
jgi:hypothetical protein